VSFESIPLAEHSGDPELLTGIFILTLIITGFAIVNIIRFFGIWRKYRDFISVILIGLPFLILIDELWSLYSQWVQLTHSDLAMVEHLRAMRWLRLIERSAAVIMLSIFVFWNLKDD